MKTIVFIHGMYMTLLCSKGWLEFFQNKGYRCLAPGWPRREGSPAELRNRHPDPHWASSP